MRKHPGEACEEAVCKQLFHIGGSYSEAKEAYAALLDWIENNDTDEISDYCSTQYGAGWGDIVAGSFWFFCHNYDGQWSEEYELSCRSSKLYDPGPCANGAEPGSGELEVYEAWERLLADDL